jgi:hypothetical protein
MEPPIHPLAQKGHALCDATDVTPKRLADDLEVPTRLGG